MFRSKKKTVDFSSCCSAALWPLATHAQPRNCCKTQAELAACNTLASQLSGEFDQHYASPVSSQGRQLPFLITTTAGEAELHRYCRSSAALRPHTIGLCELPS